MKINRLKYLINIIIVVSFICLCILLKNKYPKNTTIENIVTISIPALIALIVPFLNFYIKSTSKLENSRPIWKTPKFPFEIEFFTADGSGTVLDSVKYFVIDSKHHNQWNQLEVPNNAILSSNCVQKIKSENIIVPHSNKSSYENDENFAYNYIIVIKSTTIYNEDVYYFLGDTLDGSLVNRKCINKYYQGNWSCCKKSKAKKIIKEIG